MVIFVLQCSSAKTGKTPMTAHRIILIDLLIVQLIVPVVSGADEEHMR